MFPFKAYKTFRDTSKFLSGLLAWKIINSVVFLAWVSLLLQQTNYLLGEIGFLSHIYISNN